MVRRASNALIQNSAGSHAESLESRQCMHGNQSMDQVSRNELRESAAERGFWLGAPKSGINSGRGR
jgi:hypothetical protein